MMLYGGVLLSLLSTLHPARSDKNADIHMTFTNMSCTGDHVRSVFQSVALCEPRKKVIKLPLPSNSSILQMSPQYIAVARCGGGGCHGSRQICVSTLSRMKTVPVLLGRCGITAGKCEKECASVKVEEDIECGCQCAIKKEHCNELQDHRPDLCSCECRDKKLVRSCEESPGRVWDPSTCSCQCPVKKNKDCSTGLVFDEEFTCSCIPEIGGTNDVPVERKQRSRNYQDFFLSWEIIIIIILTIIIFLFIIVTVSLVIDLSRLRGKMRKIIADTYQLYNVPPINAQTMTGHQMDHRTEANEQDTLQRNGSLGFGGYSDNSGSVVQYGGYRKINSYPTDEFVDSISQYSGLRTITPYSDIGYESYIGRPSYNAFRSLPHYQNNEFNGSMSQNGSYRDSGFRTDSQYHQKEQNEQNNIINMKHQGNYRFPLVQQGRYKNLSHYQLHSMERPYQGGRLTPSSGCPNTPTASPIEGLGYPHDSGIGSEAARSLLSASIDTPVPNVVDDNYNPIISSVSRPLLAPKPRLYNQDMNTMTPPHINKIGQNMQPRSKFYDADDYSLQKLNGENEIPNNFSKEEQVQTEYVGSFEDDKTNEAIMNNTSDTKLSIKKDEPLSFLASNPDFYKPITTSSINI